MEHLPVLDLNSRVQRLDEVPWKVLDDTVVMLDLASGDFFDLDEVASRIWEWLDGTRTIAECTAQLVDAYDVTADRARSDVIAFVSDLLAKGLVRIR